MGIHLTLFFTYLYLDHQVPIIIFLYLVYYNVMIVYGSYTSTGAHDIVSYHHEEYYALQGAKDKGFTKSSSCCY
jgi:hypothetical protein